MIAIYARQSKDKKDSISIETQIEACKRVYPDEVCEVFSDKGYSGSNTKRPKLIEMMERIRNGEFTRIVVYRLDRFSRSLLDFTQTYSELKKHNIAFESVNEHFDTNTPLGEAVMNIIVVFAELERKTIQSRISDNYSARGEKGMYLGGPPPFGFNKIPTNLDEKRTYMLSENQYGEVVRKIFEMYSDSDCSLGDIVKYLMRECVPSPTNKGWDGNRIGLILRNPVYVKADARIYSYYKSEKGCKVTNDISAFTGQNGCYLYGRRKGYERKYTNFSEHKLSIALHEGLVDSDTFLTCQRKLDSNRQIGNSGKGKFTWLSGLVKCGNCGYAIRFTAQQSSGDRYASCSGKTNKHICDGLGEKSVLMKNIESVVEADLLQYLNNNREQLLTQRPKQIDNSTNIELISVQQKIENLLEELENGALTDTSKELLYQRLNILSAKQKELEYQLQAESYSIISENKIFYMYDLLDRWDNLSIEEKKDVAHACISKVLLTDSEITIEYKLLL